MKPVLTLFALIPLCLVACGGPTAASEAGFVADAAAAKSEAGIQPASISTGVNVAKSADRVPALQERMVIRSATLSVRVQDVESAEKAVASIVRDAGGFVGSASSTDLASAHPVLNIEMRVPVGRFDPVIGKLEALGVRLSKGIQSQDVTEQVVDLDARMKTMRAEEATLRRLLANASSTEAMLPIQQRLTDLRGTIESMIAQRSSLAKQAALSTISLTLEQSEIINKPAQDPNWLSQAWGGSTSAFANILRGLAAIMIWLMVFSPFWLPVAFIALRSRQRRRDRPSAPPVLRES